MSFVLQVFIPNKQSFKKPFVKEENIVKQFIFWGNEKADGIYGHKSTASERVPCVLEDASFSH